MLHSNKYHTYVLLDDISDHYPLLMKLTCNKDKITNTSENVTFRIINETTIGSINNYLNNVDWDILNTLNIDNGYDYLVNKITEALNLYAPEKTKKFNNKYLPKNIWMTPGLINSLKKKNKLFNKQKGKPLDSLEHQTYITFRNLYNKTIRAAKFNYYNKKIQESKYDPKLTWKVINEVLNKDRGINTQRFVIDNIETTDSNQISNGFCKYFSNIGCDLANKMLSIIMIRQC